MNGCCKGSCIPALVGKILLIIGGINWGLVGIGMLMSSNWNVVNLLLGQWSTLEAIIYMLVGVAAVVKIFGCKCKKCQVACAECCVDPKVEGGM